MNSSPAPAKTDPRRRTGATGERLAAEHFQRLGFEIVERNFRTRYGELDLIATDGHQIVFCEVKTRRLGHVPGDGPAAVDPLESIHPRKRHQVRRIATRWLAERPDRPRAERLRFDAIGVVIDENGRLLKLEHIEDAF